MYNRIGHLGYKMPCSIVDLSCARDPYHQLPILRFELFELVAQLPVSAPFGIDNVPQGRASYALIVHLPASPPLPLL